MWNSQAVRNSIRPLRGRGGAEGMVVGTSLRPLKFSPYNNVLRAQLLTMVVRAGRALGRGALSAPPEGWKGDCPRWIPRTVRTYAGRSTTVWSP